MPHMTRFIGLAKIRKDSWEEAAKCNQATGIFI